jgi:hypothetical protein
MPNYDPEILLFKCNAVNEVDAFLLIAFNANKI